MKTSCLMGGMVLAVCAQTAFAAVSGEGSVFDDTQLWIRGFRDTKGKGIVSAYADVPNATDASTQVPGLEYYNQGNDLVLAAEDVYCPYANTTLSAQPCCYLKQAVNDNKEGYFGSFGTRVKNGGKVCITNAVATVVARVRPEAPLANTGTHWLFGNIGFQFGFTTNYVNGELCLKLQGYANNASNGGNWQGSNINVKPGEWLDVAVVRTGPQIVFYAITNNSTILSQTFSITQPQNVYSNFFFGYNSNGSWGLTKTGRAQSFRGSIHQLAVWSRALSQSEVCEAFAFPRKQIWSAGIINGSEKEFPTATPGASAADPNNWHSVPSTLAKDVASEFSFNLTALEAPLSQLLHLTATAESTSGTIDVSINGSSAGSFMSEPGKTALFLVSSEFLKEGANTITLTRTDAGSTIIDALSFGGSWQLGYDGYTYSEFGSDGLPGYANCGLFKTVGRAMGAMQTNVVNVVMSKEEAEDYIWDFTVQVYTSHGLNNHPQPLQGKLLVNGQELKLVTFTKQYQDPFRIRIPSGVLKEGNNILGFNYLLPTEASKNRWLCMDYWRMEVARKYHGMEIILR